MQDKAHLAEGSTGKPKLPGTQADKLISIKMHLVVGALLELILVLVLDIICHRIMETSTRCIINLSIPKIVIFPSKGIRTRVSSVGVAVAVVAILMPVAVVGTSIRLIKASMLIRQPIVNPRPRDRSVEALQNTLP